MQFCSEFSSAEHKNIFHLSFGKLNEQSDNSWYFYLTCRWAFVICAFVEFPAFHVSFISSQVCFFIKLKRNSNESQIKRRKRSPLARDSSTIHVLIELSFESQCPTNWKGFIMECQKHYCRWFSRHEKLFSFYLLANKTNRNIYWIYVARHLLALARSVSCMKSWNKIEAEVV